MGGITIGGRDGLSISCLIFRCNSGMTSVFYSPCTTSLQYVFPEYVCSNIAQMPYTQAQVQAHMPLLPDNRAACRRNIHILNNIAVFIIFLSLYMLLSRFRFNVPHDQKLLNTINDLQNVIIYERIRANGLRW